MLNDLRISGTRLGRSPTYESPNVSQSKYIETLNRVCPCHDREATASSTLLMWCGMVKGEVKSMNPGFKSANLRKSARLLSKALGVSKNPLQYITDKMHKMDPRRFREIVENPESNEHVRSTMEIMSQVTLEDVGMDKMDPFSYNVPFCMDIYKTALFHMCVFVVPKGMSLPLHDHPTMTVISKVLTGSINVRTFTKMEPADNIAIEAGKPNIHELSRAENRVPTDDAWLLTPDQENIHEFIAEEPAVILDVLIPPYGDARPCSYYECVEINEGKRKGCFSMQVLGEDFTPENPVYNGKELYRGYIPKISADALN